MAGYKVSDVYGISRDLPLNYVSREWADDAFIASLTRDKHVVVYGSSKQGKTSLVKHCLKEEDYVKVQCSNKWGLSNLNAAILKAAGYKMTTTEKISVSGKAKVLATFTGWLGLKVGGEAEVGRASEVTTQSLELDIDDVNDIIEALECVKFKKFIVLDDFHYLTEETQRDFAVQLKAFHEASELCFVVIGVWLEENRLIVYNGDLTGRIVAINADLWTAEKLQEVVRSGEGLLNIKFVDYFKDAVIGGSYESVYIVQEACHRACVESGCHSTVSDEITLGDGLDAEAIIRAVVNEQSGRYDTFLRNFADGFQTTELEMYKWILYPIIMCDDRELNAGFKASEVRKRIAEKHPRGADLNPGNVIQALKFATSLQIQKQIKPIILDYDQTNGRLSVVDRSFIIWKKYQDREDLLEKIGLQGM
ncbi:MAG: hypothetical protein ACLGSA_13310 [Acidobacteriota bacterium]